MLPAPVTRDPTRSPSSYSVATMKAFIALVEIWEAARRVSLWSAGVDPPQPPLNLVSQADREPRENFLNPYAIEGANYVGG